tara:strand:+ start:2326 stop:2592 length:267 start_codon:yes stop_codon:yes gene_type:complete
MSLLILHKDKKSMPTLLLTLGLIGIFFIFMSVRLILLKNGEFKGTCASQSPFLNKDGAACGFCGKEIKPGESCGNPDSEVDKVMAKFK